MSRKKSNYLQMAAYVMLAFIFIFVIGIARNCSNIPSVPIEGFSGGDTIDIALIYTPGGYYLYSDTLSGINIELTNEFSRQTKQPVKTWPVADSEDALHKLESGAFNILASLPLDNSIKQKFPVSESVFLDRLVLVQTSDTVSQKKKINSPLDLNGQTVHVTASSSAAQRMKNLSQEIGGKIEVIEVPEISEELLALKVANGSIPLAVVNEKVARKIAGSYSNLVYDSNISFTQFQVWIFNESDSLLYNNFNEWLEGFRATEDYREIIEKY